MKNIIYRIRLKWGWGHELLIKILITLYLLSTAATLIITAIYLMVH